MTVSGRGGQVGLGFQGRAAAPAAGAIATADSLIAALCREADGLRQHGRQLLSALERCQHAGLQRRLERELAQLQQRRSTLRSTARGWQQRRLADPLSVALLVELASRPLVSRAN